MMNMNLKLRFPSWIFPFAPILAFFMALYIIAKYIIKTILT